MTTEIKSMSPATIKILKATAPVVQCYGTQITETMYPLMLKRYPEVKNYFNMSHFRKDGDSTKVAPQVSTSLHALFSIVCPYIFAIQYVV